MTFRVKKLKPLKDIRRRFELFERNVDMHTRRIVLLREFEDIAKMTKPEKKIEFLRSLNGGEVRHIVRQKGEEVLPFLNSIPKDSLGTVLCSKLGQTDEFLYHLAAVASPELMNGLQVILAAQPEAIQAKIKAETQTNAFFQFSNSHRQWISAKEPVYKGKPSSPSGLTLQ